jgi:hypothetical protein
VAEDSSAKGVGRNIRKKVKAEVKDETKFEVRGWRSKVTGYRLQVKELKFMVHRP